MSKLTEEVKAQIRELHGAGMPVKEIAEEVGFSHVSVRKVIKDSAAQDTEETTAPEWMQHVTPLHLEKQRLEQEIEQKKEALDAARQEYRNFLATVRQLGEDML